MTFAESFDRIMPNRYPWRSPEYLRRRVHIPTYLNGQYELRVDGTPSQGVLYVFCLHCSENVGEIRKPDDCDLIVVQHHLKHQQVQAVIDRLQGKPRTDVFPS